MKVAGGAPEYANQPTSVPFSFASGDSFSPMKRKICGAGGKKWLRVRASAQGDFLGVFFP
jgi:hypothetical protein